MTDEPPEKPAMLTFASDEIARIMWDAIDPAKTGEPVTFDNLNSALRIALLTHLGRQARERVGKKPN